MCSAPPWPAATSPDRRPAVARAVLRSCARTALLAAWTAGLVVLPSSGQSQTFACGEAVAGQLSVQANVQCACRWFNASALRGTPAGYRWDCGILRARTNHDVPATANPYPYPLPGALSLDRAIILQSPLSPPR